MTFWEKYYDNTTLRATLRELKTIGEGKMNRLGREDGSKELMIGIILGIFDKIESKNKEK